jgi:glycosyltransferase involved in cell wall biosynthesis
MRALHVTSYFLTHESRVFKVTRSMVRLGFMNRVDVVGRQRADLPHVERLDPRRTIIRIKSNIPRNTIGRVLGFAGWSGRVLRRFRSGGYSVICCHSLACLPVSYLLAKFNGASLIYEPHELETETSRVPRGPIRTISRWLERLFARKADSVIVVGQEIASWYRRELGLEKVSVVMNCPHRVDTSRSDLVRRAAGVSPSLPIFLYQGILSKNRGLEVAIAAFQGLEHEAVLVMLGYGPLADELKEHTSRFPNVFVLPPIPPDDLLRWTASADFGLSLIEPISRSYEFCVPNKLFEYVMAQVPVLVSATTEQRRIVEDFGVGRVCPRLDPESVRNAVRTLIADGASKYQPALARARDEFSWEGQEEVLKQVYGEIAKAHSVMSTPVKTEGIR